MIAGDMNIHFDQESNSVTARYRELLHAFGLSQKVKFTTHTGGHILDHIIYGDVDSTQITNLELVDPISDHFCVTADVSIEPTNIAF